MYKQSKKKKKKVWQYDSKTFTVEMHYKILVQHDYINYSVNFISITEKRNHFGFLSLT